MRRAWIYKLLVAATVWLLLANRPSAAQDVCRGDVEQDGVLSANDVATEVEILYTEDLDPLLRVIADANSDGGLGAADVVAIIASIGSACATATPTFVVPTLTPTVTPTRTVPTPTATPTFTMPTATSTRSPTNSPTGPPGSPTMTPTRTATRTTTLTPTITSTFTPRATATPTSVCVIQSIQPGNTSGQLTAGDCLRTVGGVQRHSDVYSFSGTPGTLLSINVTVPAGASSIVPIVVVDDADGQFDRIEGHPPIQLTLASAAPYHISIASDPTSAVELGSYTLNLSVSTCPTPVALSVPGARSATLDPTDCPDPGTPNVGSKLNPVDVYTFTVAQAPTNLVITMRQTSEDDTIDPSFTILGPDGVEVVSPDDDDDAAPGGFGVDAQARFLALTTGTYTLIAGGGQGTGHYQLTLISPTSRITALTNIPADRPLVCPGQSGPGCTGMLYGDPNRTIWGAPLPIPGISDDTPEVGSGSDLYTFTASPGDVISVEMDSDDDAHLYLLGPDSAGYPLVTQDDDSGSSGATSDAQLAATLVVPGTYMIVAANNNVLLPPDPEDPTDIGDVVNYSLFVQKCPVRGALNPVTGLEVNDTFSTTECFGFGGIPFRSYALSGSAQQFVTVSMRSTDVDASLRLIAPDGRVVQNDNDPFDPFTSDARVSRIRQTDGIHFVEVSTSIDQGPVDVTSFPPPAFSVVATACDATAVSPGDVNGSWQSNDCQLSTGQRYDVYTFTPNGTLPQAASIRPPVNGCVLTLLATGPQTPDSGCATGLAELPLTSNGTYGFMVAGADDTTRGAYSARLGLCPATTAGFGSVLAGALADGTCTDPNGLPAGWFVVRGLANIALFNDGVSGRVEASQFVVHGTLTDQVSGVDVAGEFSTDPTTMFPLGTDLGALLKVNGATAAARGSYTVRVDPAALRQ